MNMKPSKTKLAGHSTWTMEVCILGAHVATAPPGPALGCQTGRAECAAEIAPRMTRQLRWTADAARTRLVSRPTAIILSRTSWPDTGEAVEAIRSMDCVLDMS
mmetsp:Transcript_13925/g.36988  ORF Transcript_13925/g.36988 Transcript_13925/m.36988 type:complete len:103 (-) Transcript_13925:1311-1619(-)